MKRLAWLAFVCAACTTDKGLEADTIDSSFLAAFEEPPSPTTCAILLIVNIATVEVLDLGVPLDERAAQAIVAYRAGDDTVPGTSDDRRIASLEELDAIDWVGPVAFSNLRGYVDAQGLTCLAPPPDAGVEVPDAAGPPLELLENGGFDDTTGSGMYKQVAGWKLVIAEPSGYLGLYVRSAAELTGIAPHQGDFAVQATGDGYAVFCQSVPVPAWATRLRLTGVAAVTAEPAATGKLHLGLQEVSLGTPPILAVSLDAASASDGWVAFDREVEGSAVTALATATPLFCISHEGGTAILRLDSLSLVAH